MAPTWIGGRLGARPRGQPRLDLGRVGPRRIVPSATEASGLGRWPLRTTIAHRRCRHRGPAGGAPPGVDRWAGKASVARPTLSRRYPRCRPEPRPTLPRPLRGIAAVSAPLEARRSVGPSAEAAHTHRRSRNGRGLTPTPPTARPGPWRRGRCRSSARPYDRRGSTCPCGARCWVSRTHPGLPGRHGVRPDRFGALGPRYGRACVDHPGGRLADSVRRPPAVRPGTVPGQRRHRADPWQPDERRTVRRIAAPARRKAAEHQRPSSCWPSAPGNADRGTIESEATGSTAQSTWASD